MAVTVTRFEPARRVARRAHAFSFLRTHALECFIVLEYACQLALLSSDIGQLRLLVRMMVFGTSIAMLLLLSGRGEPSPAAAPAKLVLAILGIALFHPNTNTISAGCAQIGMYLAILAPLFWVARLKVDTPTLLRLLMIIWIFQTISAAVGILQVYSPGRFEPSLAIVTQKMGSGYLKSLQFRNAYGETTWRAMGLTDTPGGAAYAGFFAALLGTGFMLTRKGPQRLLATGTIVIGLVAIYLSKNRSCLIVLAVCELGTAAMIVARRTLLVLRPEWRKRESGNLPRLVVAVSLAVVLSFSWAIAVGGGSITERFSSLMSDRPSEVYRQNRGHFIEASLESLLPQYPLGAGIGRWGMMNYYFGDNSNPDTRGIWVEEQWTAWLLDGGVPLILAYVLAIFIAMRTAFKIALSPVEPELAFFAVIICGYDLGAFASSFGYAYFASQDGLEFWLLNAALFAAFLGFRKRVSAETTARRDQQESGRVSGGSRYPVGA
jgi:hypothetical protein